MIDRCRHGIPLGNCTRCVNMSRPFIVQRSRAFSQFITSLSPESRRVVEDGEREYLQRRGFWAKPPPMPRTALPINCLTEEEVAVLWEGSHQL